MPAIVSAQQRPATPTHHTAPRHAAFWQVTPPERVGPYLYYVRQLPDRPHPCYMRRTERGAEEVVLDVNELARVHGDCVSVGQVGGPRRSSACQRGLTFNSHLSQPVWPRCAARGKGIHVMRLEGGVPETEENLHHFRQVFDCCLLLGVASAAAWQDGQVLCSTVPQQPFNLTKQALVKCVVDVLHNVRMRTISNSLPTATATSPASLATGEAVPLQPAACLHPGGRGWQRTVLRLHAGPAIWPAAATCST